MDLVILIVVVILLWSVVGLLITETCLNVVEFISDKYPKLSKKATIVGIIISGPVSWFGILTILTNSVKDNTE